MEVMTPSTLQLPPGEMEKDTSLASPPMPSASSTAVDEGQQVSTSEAPSKSETEPSTCPQTSRKPSISKVILKAVADKGGRNRVSLAALKKAMATTGYDMPHNTWRLKCALRKLVNKGMLKQVTGKGATGSFRLGKKQASKPKLQVKRRQQRRRRPGQRQSRQCRSLPGSRQGHKQLFKKVRRVAKGCHN